MFDAILKLVYKTMKPWYYLDTTETYAFFVPDFDNGIIEYSASVKALFSVVECNNPTEVVLFLNNEKAANVLVDTRRLFQRVKMLIRTFCIITWRRFCVNPQSKQPNRWLAGGAL